MSVKKIKLLPFLAEKCYKTFKPSLIRSNVAYFYYDEKRDLCQITFKGSGSPGSKNIFYDVESCKKHCLTNKHSYDEIPKTKKYDITTTVPSTEIKRGLMFV